MIMDVTPNDTLWKVNGELHGSGEQESSPVVVAGWKYDIRAYVFGIVDP